MADSAVVVEDDSDSSEEEIQAVSDKEEENNVNLEASTTPQNPPVAPRTQREEEISR